MDPDDLLPVGGAELINKNVHPFQKKKEEKKSAGSSGRKTGNLEQVDQWRRPDSSFFAAAGACAPQLAWLL